MRSTPWVCQYQGCRSSPEQIDLLRARRPEGFPHDEDSALRVCTVCRRRPLKDQSMEELSAAFLAGIKEELSTIEENENNIQALSQVFRYYAKHAVQLSQVLFDFTTKQCFPWEVIHALHLVDDILLMDTTSSFRAEFADKIEALTVHSFKKAQSDDERKEVARVFHAWNVLKIFETPVLQAVRNALRAIGPSASSLIEEVSAADEEDEEDEGQRAPAPPSSQPAERGEAKAAEDADAAAAATREAAAAAAAQAAKRRRLAAEAASNGKQQAAQPSAARVALSQKVLAIVDKILSIPVGRPFEMLGLDEATCNGHDIRKAYRKLALLIHPDKNPGFESKCQEALIKLQQGREQAESQPRPDSSQDKSKGVETRAAATSSAATSGPDASCRCRYPTCELPPCKQCANGCCTRNITHCHMIARSKAGVQCFFHPPPRAWARNA